MRLFRGVQIFQSTPPRRRRPVSPSAEDKEEKFQSTPPRRRRHEYEGLPYSYIAISIHASEKEATVTIDDLGSLSEISIHASEKEATATYCDTSTIMYISSLNNFFVHYF